MFNVMWKWKWVGKSRIIMRSGGFGGSVGPDRQETGAALCWCSQLLLGTLTADCHIATVNKEDADTRAVTPALVLCNAAAAITQRRAPAQYAASRPAL